MISLFKPHMPPLPEIEGILASGNLSYGKYTKEFEEKLKAYFGTPYIIATNSFGSAVSVAASTLGLSFGDEVIASPMACLVSTQPYATCGLKIKWCDVDSLRGTINPDDLRKKISSSTKAIIHNHFCGFPGYIDEVNAVAHEYGIPVIDDGIECFGSEYKGKKIGNCGSDVTVFSFSAVRIPNTIDGGAVIFRDKSLYEKSLRIRDCGIDRANFRDDLGEINPECDITEQGFAAMMSDVNGYIGSRQMDDAEKLIARQRENALWLDTRIESMSKLYSLSAENCLPNYWVYGVLSDKKRESIEFFRSKGLYASGVHINNNIYSVFGNTDALRGVNEFFGRFFALPCGWWVNYNDGNIF